MYDDEKDENISTNSNNDVFFDDDETVEEEQNFDEQKVEDQQSFDTADEVAVAEPKKSLGQKIKEFFKMLPTMGKNIDPSKPLYEQRNVTFWEYFFILLTRFGVVLFTTINVDNFLYECFWGGIGVSNEALPHVILGLTTTTTIIGYLVGAAAATVAYKWRTKLGRYRHWYLINLIPMLILYILSFYVPKTSTTGGIVFRYCVMIGMTIFNGFSGVGDNITQVISPNPKEKNAVIIVQQVGYYLGYGGYFLYTLVFGKLFPDQKRWMYLSIAVFAAVVVTVGKLFMALRCKERIEIPHKEKEKLTTSVITLFKDKNYVAYWTFNWVNVLAMVGKMTSYLAAIVVGTDKGLVFSIPSAAGTVTGIVICILLQKKFSCTSILKFVGFYATGSALLCFFAAMLTGYGIVFYVFYFLFGLSLGLQELSTNQFNVQFNDYLEWKTGKRLEAVQGVIPGWINGGLDYAKAAVIPYMLAAIGYVASDSNNLLETAKSWENYDNICLWLLAFALFGFAAANLIKSFILLFWYDVQGKKRIQMYKDLEEMRRRRHEENLVIDSGEQTEVVAE